MALAARRRWRRCPRRELHLARLCEGEVRSGHVLWPAVGLHRWRWPRRERRSGPSEEATVARSSSHLPDVTRRLCANRQSCVYMEVAHSLALASIRLLVERNAWLYRLTSLCLLGVILLLVFIVCLRGRLEEAGSKEFVACLSLLLKLEGLGSPLARNWSPCRATRRWTPIVVLREDKSRSRCCLS